MIDDLSRSLRALLSQPGLPPSLGSAQIVFDRPAEPFNPSQSTLDLYLYDIRENRDMTATGAGHMLACTYLITAWPVGGEEIALQEQQLLAEAAQVLLAFPRVPPCFLQGALAGQPPPHLLVLLPEALRNSAEFWTALGNKLRPSISLTASIRLSPLPLPEESEE